MDDMTGKAGRLQRMGIYAAGVALLMSAVLVRCFHRDGLRLIHSAQSSETHPGSGSVSIPSDFRHELDDLDAAIDPSLRQRILEGRRAHERARLVAGNDGKVLPGPEFETFDDEGLVSRSLLELAGIDISRRDELDEIVSRLRNTISSSMEPRAVYLGVESRDKGSARIFLVKASPEAAGEFKKLMEGEIAARFGSGAARVLLPYLAKPEYLGGMGKYTIRLEFDSRTFRSGAFGAVSYSVTDPVTGANIAEGGNGNAEVYDRHFGNLLAGETTKEFWEGIPKSG